MKKNLLVDFTILTFMLLSFVMMGLSIFLDDTIMLVLGMVVFIVDYVYIVTPIKPKNNKGYGA